MFIFILVKKERSAKDASEGKIDKDTWTLSDYNSAPQDRLPFLFSRADSFGNSGSDRPASPLNEKFGSLVKSSPCDMRRRSSDQLGTAPPLSAINSDTSSSSDARQHLVQVGTHIDYMEPESNAPPPSNNNYSGTKGLMSGISSESTGFSVTSSPCDMRRRSSDQLGTAPLLSGINSDTSSSSDVRQSLVQVDNHIEYTESEQSVPPNLDRNLPTTPSPDGSEENERRARLEKKTERDRINQKKHYDKIKANCEKAQKEIPRLREKWEKLEKENQDQLNLLNDEQKREIVAISEGFEKQLDDAELSVKKLKTKPIKDDKMPASTYNTNEFRRKQNLVLKQQELEELRLKEQQDISKKIRELTC
ncbi:unnamed protein product [Caenorhabditis brenneri]